MAHPQIFRHPFDLEHIQETVQVAQISYHDERVITVDYHLVRHCPVVQENEQWFTMESPDLPNGFTMRDIFTALGYQNEQMVLTYPEDGNLHNYLDTNIEQAPLSQLTFYAPGQPIPNEHYQGPLPQVAGAPINEPQDILPELLIPNANPDFSHHPGADDDDGSTIAAQSPLSISSESFN
jgi:hypothetical protein